MSGGLQAGQTVAGYRIEAPLGQGGMGVVYLAEHLRLGRKVALKILAPHLAADETFRQRFIRESQIAAAIDHPNIVPIYDADEVEGMLYIAMRYVEGSDLRAVLEEKGRLSTSRTLALLEQVAGALDAAHARGLVHRDVKPANILIVEPGDRVFVTDFGAAKESTGPALTRTGFFIGTVSYAAPEQIEGRPVGPGTDVYALGCVLFQCLSGSPPYDQESEVAVIYAHLREPPPSLSAVRDDVPAALDTVIATAMAKDSAARYGTATALVSAARAAAADKALAAEPTLPAAPVTVPAPQPVEPAAPPTVEAPAPPPSRTRRRLLLFALAGAAAAAALAGGIYALVGRDDSGEGAGEAVDRLLAPVLAADSELGRSLAGLNDNETNLADARLAASRVAEESTRAQSVSSGLELPAERESARKLLEQALKANLDYAQKVATAAADLTSARAAAAEEAEGGTRFAYDELETAWPEVVDPSPPALSGAVELRLLAQEEAAGDQGEEQQRDYVQAVDALLRNSAETRGDLAGLIADVQSRRISFGDARDGIETIINQRLGLRDDVAAIPAPEPYRRAKELLRRSITLSIEDDIAVRRWINAFYDDLPSASQRLTEVTTLGRQATAAKERFVAEYNRVRRETLRLGPLGVGTRY